MATFATSAAPRKELLIPHSCKTLQGENEIMKTTKLIMLVMTIAVVLLFSFPICPGPPMMEARSSKQSARCAMGRTQTGKSAAKISSLVSPLSAQRFEMSPHSHFGTEFTF